MSDNEAEVGVPGMKQLDIGGLEAFNCKGDSSNLGQRWVKWKRGFKLYITAKGVENNMQKRVMMMILTKLSRSLTIILNHLSTFHMNVISSDKLFRKVGNRWINMLPD